MRKFLRCFTFVVIGLFLFAGCTSHFVYNHPEIQQTESKSSNNIIAYKGINDDRELKDIDKIYKNNPLDDINKIIREEILSTGLFKDVILISDDKINNKEYLTKNNVNFLLNSSLKKLNWEVPNYGALLAKTFTVSFLTGGLGGMIYGSTPTDVYGDTTINIKLIDINSGVVYIDKEYSGHYEEKMPKMSCDTAETKSKMAGYSLKICMDEFKSDLAEAVKKNSTEISVVSSSQKN